MREQVPRVLIRFDTLPLESRQRRYGRNGPPLRNQPQLRFHHLHLILAGEAEVHEPLPVDRLRHLLQDCDPADVVLDQVVVGRESLCDPPLDVERRQGDLTVGNSVSGSVRFNMERRPLVAEQVSTPFGADSSRTDTDSRSSSDSDESKRCGVQGNHESPQELPHSGPMSLHTQRQCLLGCGVTRLVHFGYSSSEM